MLQWHRLRYEAKKIIVDYIVTKPTKFLIVWHPKLDIWSAENKHQIFGFTLLPFLLQGSDALLFNWIIEDKKTVNLLVD